MAGPEGSARTRIRPKDGPKGRPKDDGVAGPSGGGGPLPSPPPGGATPPPATADRAAEVAPAPKPRPAAEPASAAGAVTAETPMRRIGDLPRSAWETELRRLNSPLLAELDGILRAASPHGALGLVQAARESGYGTADNARRTNNPLGLMVRGSSPSRLQAFASWAEAFAEFRRRISDAGPPYDPEDISIQEYLAVYVGGPDCRRTNGKRCANGETWKGKR